MNLAFKTIEGFAAQLDQVFVNIIDNACYALFEQFKQSGIQFVPKLEICTQSADHHITIKIKDNGIGIPQDNLDKIFEPFFTTKPTGSGTGLGLSLAYDIITLQHNGTIEVKSIPYQFSEFIITLSKTLTKM